MKLAKREQDPDHELPLPDGYRLASVRLFEYWLAGLGSLDLLRLSDLDAQGFLSALNEYRAYGGRR